MSDPAPTSAVQRCCEAFHHTTAAELAKGTDDYTARKLASHAFRNAMPFLTGYANIRDFIACVAHGILLEAIDSKLGAKLLYAAQVALGAYRLRPAETQSELKPVPAQTRPAPATPPQTQPPTPSPSPAPAQSPSPARTPIQPPPASPSPLPPQPSASTHIDPQSPPPTPSPSPSPAAPPPQPGTPSPLPPRIEPHADAPPVPSPAAA
jgi:hypothetical protein